MFTSFFVEVVFDVMSSVYSFVYANSSASSFAWVSCHLPGSRVPLAPAPCPFPFPEGSSGIGLLCQPFLLLFPLLATSHIVHGICTSSHDTFLRERCIHVCIYLRTCIHRSFIISSKYKWNFVTRECFTFFHEFNIKFNFFLTCGIV